MNRIKKTDFFKDFTNIFVIYKFHFSTHTSRLQRGLIYVGFVIHCTNKLDLRIIEFI